MDDKITYKEAILNFSYVISDRLAAMSRPGALDPLEEDLQFLRDKGIQCIVSLTELPLNSEFIERYGFEYLHIPVPDMIAPTIEQVETFVRYVGETEEANRQVVVHCGAGRGRTGTMLSCYFVSKGRSAETAIKEIRELRPGSIETAAQVDAVYNYERHRGNKAAEGSE